MRVLESERLYVRHLVMNDLENYYRLNGDAEIMRYIRPAKTREETAIFLKQVIDKYALPHVDWRMALLEKDTDIFVGSFAIIPLDNTSELQLGYALLKEYWGKGYATEITKAGTQYAFYTLGLDSIAAVTDVANTASQHVLLKSGFVFEHIRLEGEKKLNIYRNTKLPDHFS